MFPPSEGLLPGMWKSVKNNLEIERKFLIKELPENLKQYPREEVVQGYLSASSGDAEIRLRKMGKKYFQTFKKGACKVRREMETVVTQKKFKTLWPDANKQKIRKTRYKIPYGQHIIELDVYLGKLKRLITAEIEFKTVKDSNKFVIPKWFGREITDDIKYKNRSLALRGLPKK